MKGTLYKRPFAKLVQKQQRVCRCVPQHDTHLKDICGEGARSTVHFVGGTAESKEELTHTGCLMFPGVD